MKTSKNLPTEKKPAMMALPKYEMSFVVLIVQRAKLSKLCLSWSVCMKQPFHAKDRVAAYVRKVVGAAAKGTGQ